MLGSGVVAGFSDTQIVVGGDVGGMKLEDGVVEACAGVLMSADVSAAGDASTETLAVEVESEGSMVGAGGFVEPVTGVPSSFAASSGPVEIGTLPGNVVKEPW